MQVLVKETRKAQSRALIADQEHSNLMQHCHLLYCSTVSSAVVTSVNQLLVQAKCDVAHRTRFRLNKACIFPMCHYVNCVLCLQSRQNDLMRCNEVFFVLMSACDSQITASVYHHCP